MIEERVLSESKGELKKEAVPVSTNPVSKSEEKTSLSECIGLEHFSSKSHCICHEVYFKIERKDQEHKEHSKLP